MLRAKSNVATSLATAQRRGNVDGYGRRASIDEPSFIVISKTRLKPPSASFSKLQISETSLFTDVAAAFLSSSTLNSKRRSVRRLDSL